MLLQAGEIAIGRRPDLLEVEPEVVMNEDVPHADDGGPRHRGVSVAQLIRESPTRLADDLQVVYHPDLEERFAIKGRTAPGGLLLDAVDPGRPEGARRRASKGHGLPEDAIAQPGPQPLLDRNVDLAAEKLLELDHQGRVVQQAATFFEVDEQVQVALRPRLAARDRPDDADVASTEPPRHLKDLHPLLVDSLSNTHALSIRRQGPARAPRFSGRSGPFVGAVCADSGEVRSVCRSSLRRT